ncbi:MAG: hypothetical protein EBZ77_00705 [Chitinophagia bacterium]|nr:hypothetical protein [Chitinophagia bacterium]
MAFYSRKLSSASDLEQEKERISKRLEDLKKEQLLPLSGFGKAEGKQPAGEAAKGQSGFQLPAWLAPGHPLFDLGVDIVKSRLRKRRKTTTVAVEPEKPSKRPMWLSIILEIGLGYLKWKALELVFNAIAGLISNRKKKSTAS